MRQGSAGGGFGRVEGDDGAVVEAGAFAEGCCGGCVVGWLTGAEMIGNIGDTVDKGEL